MVAGSPSASPSLDRLSALMARFALRVTPSAPEAAHLIALADRPSGPPERVLLRRSPKPVHDSSTAVFAAEVAWGGDVNPLFVALPEETVVELGEDAELTAVVRLLAAEQAAARCGSGAVLSRLAEVVVVRLLRARIAAGDARPSLFGGLSDPRLSRAIVAIHETPERAWTVAELADVAGLSVSRFVALFAEKVGETPAGYLRRWRLSLARQDLAKGERVQAVAWRYGYGSAEAFSRAYQKAFGAAPSLSRSVPSEAT